MPGYTWACFVEGCRHYGRRWPAATREGANTGFYLHYNRDHTEVDTPKEPDTGTAGESRRQPRGA